MLRLKLGPIPVAVHFSHLLVSVLFAWTITQGDALADAWPGPILRSPHEREFYVAMVVAWTVLVVLSVFIHELGHALAARGFGYAPTIHLVGLGGSTQPNAAEEIPWLRDVTLTVAGPAFSLALAAGCAGLYGTLSLAGSLSAPAEYLLRELGLLNLLWAVLNLLPVVPLDGGRVATVLLVRLFGRSGFLVAQLLGLACAGLLIALGVIFDLLVVSLFFTLFFLRALLLLAAWRRGEAPLQGAAHPLAETLALAEQHLRDGRLDQAAAAAQKVLDAQPPAALRDRAHIAFGWLAVKRAMGKEALEHFAQVQSLPVPPLAMAAALSLTGDDARALTLWERAVVNGADPVVWHELAATLLRLGREGDVRRLPQVRLALAWAAAQRVHFLRGEFPQAAMAAEQAFREEPSAANAYDAACAWARSGDVAAAMRMLKLAAQNGFAARAEASADPDLCSLRPLAEFQDWLAGLPAPT